MIVDHLFFKYPDYKLSDKANSEWTRADGKISVRFSWQGVLILIFFLNAAICCELALFQFKSCKLHLQNIILCAPHHVQSAKVNAFKS